ncbi:Ectoine/hydroxyectoine ABC transporter permease subunit EhuC OS=Streptomyces fumanus OX=67302 GN=GCM10018772_06830 PE=3 SV=1 [Streptomyces fumanus]
MRGLEKKLKAQVGKAPRKRESALPQPAGIGGVR